MELFECVSIPTYTPNRHTHFPKNFLRVSQWKIGTNCSGRGKRLCSESKANCLAANEANGQASMCNEVTAHTHVCSKVASHSGRCKMGDISL